MSEKIDFGKMSEEEFHAHLRTLGEVPLTEALRIKNELSRRIRNNGITAPQYESMCHPGRSEWVELRKKYDEYLASFRIISSKTLTVIYISSFLITAILYFVYHDYWGYSLICGLVGIAMEGIAQAKHEGFYWGLENGIAEGVKRAHGLTEEQIKEFAELNLDLAINKSLD